LLQAGLSRLADAVTLPEYRQLPANRCGDGGVGVGGVMEEGIFQRGEEYLNKEDNAPKARRSTYAIHQLTHWQVLGCLEPAGSYPCP
jgi:hypothetical protein